jgi:hypothetical protein
MEIAALMLDEGARWAEVVFLHHLSLDGCVIVPSFAPLDPVASRRASHHGGTAEQQHRSWRVVAYVLGEALMIPVALNERYLLRFAPRAL